MTLDRITEYGRFVRDLRKNRNENLDMMSKKMGVSISFLSNLESGKKQVPSDFIDKLALVYNLDNIAKMRLINSVELTNNKTVIKLNNLSPSKKNLVLNIARNIENIDDKKAEELLNMLK
jgi:transcriptional regulator with XRE-family HTH domain